MRDPGSSVVVSMMLTCGGGAAAPGDPVGLSAGTTGSVRVSSCRVAILRRCLRLATVFTRANTNGAKPELADRAEMLEARLMLAIPAW